MPGSGVPAGDGTTTTTTTSSNQREGAYPLTSHRHRSPAPGQLLLFDADVFPAGEPYIADRALLVPHGSEDGAALQEPGALAQTPPVPAAAQDLTTPFGGHPSQEPPARAADRSSGLETSYRQPAPALETVQPRGDDLTPDGESSLVVTAGASPEYPKGEDHVCTPADFLPGAAARFEANLAAIDLLKEIENAGRGATADERPVLARFSGFGDSAFEPTFRLTAHRSEERAWVERGQASYTDQLAHPFEHEETLSAAHCELARIEAKLTCDADRDRPSHTWTTLVVPADEAAA